MASLANSLGAASSAVPSMRPSGRVRRRNARCCGDRRGGAGARRGTGQIRDHAVPHVRQLAGLIGHVRTPFDVPGGTPWRTPHP